MVSTKKQLKALNKIKEILEEVGEDSYVGVAFSGCVEYAEENLAYQRMNSMNHELAKMKREALEKKVDNDND